MGRRLNDVGQVTARFGANRASRQRLRASGMILNRLVVVCVTVCSAAGPAIVAAQPASGPGRLEGIVVRQDGSGVGGVVMLVQELGQSELTDATGKYVFGRIGPGTYTVLSTLGPHSLRQSGVVITDRTTTTLRTVVDWPLSIFESVVVNGATRQPARLVEAPGCSHGARERRTRNAGTARAAAAGAGGDAGSGARPEWPVRLQPQ